MHEASIINIQHFSIHDGPGIRTTVFFKGCNLRCWWCHNPESWQLPAQLMFYESRCIGCGACAGVCPGAREEDGVLRAGRFTDACTVCGSCAGVCYADALSIVGKTCTKQALLEELLRDESVYRRSGGGVTFSGGEPMLQHGFLAQILPELKARGIHTAVETAADVPWEWFEELLPWLDLVMSDVKHSDSAAHRRHTGVGNERILDNQRRMARRGIPLLLRTPVVPGVNDTPEVIAAIAAYAASLPGAQQGRVKYELLPYHDLGEDKYRALKLPYRGEGLKTPGEEQMQALRDVVESYGVLK